MMNVTAAELGPSEDKATWNSNIRAGTSIADEEQA
jgi:hypothetical protein